MNKSLNINVTNKTKFPEVDVQIIGTDTRLYITGTDDQIKTLVAKIWRQMEKDGPHEVGLSEWYD